MSDANYDTAATTPILNVLDGLLTREQLASQLGCAMRTVLRYEHRGMPSVLVKARLYYDPAKVRAWLETRAPKRDCNRAPVTRGRPAGSKRAA